MRETYYVRKIGEVGTRPNGETFALLTLNVDGKSVRDRLAAIPDLVMTIVAPDGTEQIREINQMVYSLDPGNFLIISPSGPALSFETASKVVFTSTLGGFSTERNEPFERVDGIDNPDTFVNLRHTPQRMMHRWAVWINSMLAYKQGSETLQNTFTKNNRQALTRLLNSDYESRARLNEVTVREGSDLSLSNFNNFNRLFTPEYIEFDAPISWQQIQLLREAHQGAADQANYGYISVVDFNGDLKQGYLQELVYNPVEEQARFKLLKKSDQPQCNLSVQVIDEGIAFRFKVSGTDAALEYQVEREEGTVVSAWSNQKDINVGALTEGSYRVRVRELDNRAANRPDCEASSGFSYVPAVALLHVRDFERYNAEQWYDQTKVYGISNITNEGNAEGQYTISVTLNGTTARLLRGDSATSLTQISAITGSASFTLREEQTEFFALEIDNQTGASQDVIVQVFDADGGEILSDGNRQSLSQITVRALVMVCDIEIDVVRERGRVTIQHSYNTVAHPTEYRVEHSSARRPGGLVAQDLNGKLLDWQVADGEIMQFSVQDNTDYIAKVRRQDAPDCLAEATFNPYQYVVHHFFGLDNVRGVVIRSRVGASIDFTPYFYLYISGYHHTKINKSNYPILNVHLSTSLPSGSVTLTYKPRGTQDQDRGGRGVLFNGNNQTAGYGAIPADLQGAFEAVNKTGIRQRVRITFTTIRPDYDIRVVNQTATTAGVNHESQTVEFYVDPQ